MSEEVKIPTVEIVDLNKLKFDGNNPNKMTHTQREALWEGMKKFGVIVPIITNNEYLISDGQNRCEVLLEHGITKGPVIKLPISDVDRRILRQVLNKLKGSHDSVLDDSEYKNIFKQNKFEELQKLLGESDQRLSKFLESMDETKEATVHVEPEVTCPKCGETFRPGKKTKDVSQKEVSDGEEKHA